MMIRRYAAAAVLVAGTVPVARASAQAPRSAPRNVVLIVSDDHRYDFMGFMERAPAWLETPSLDRMHAQGAHVRNASVTTSLCSPSRASVLTVVSGQSRSGRRGVTDVLATASLATHDSDRPSR